jgi:hypothetical protein
MINYSIISPNATSTFGIVHKEYEQIVPMEAIKTWSILNLTIKCRVIDI